MKISNVEVFTFRTWTRVPQSKWGYGYGGWEDEEFETTSSITKISTDEGAEGYMQGGRREYIEGVAKPLLLGEDPLNREKLWNWMYHMANVVEKLPEGQMGVIDSALWDLLGRMVGLPVGKLLGGGREKVKAYASTFPNMGGPEDYAQHALECKRRGYKALKVHAYIYWDPYKWEPAPLHPGYPKEDVEICKAVRETVGDDMVLMHDPFGAYTLQEALWVGRELEKLGFYWLEHPMVETRIEPYRRLTRELDIAVMAPEQLPGGVFTRAEWVLQGASDMLRIDHNSGGITAVQKMVNIAQAFGIQCEMHSPGWTQLQMLAATTDEVCEYYERGLTRGDRNNWAAEGDDPEPYLTAICDPMDDEGNVTIPQGSGLGMEFNWDYINDNLVKE